MLASRAAGAQRAAAGNRVNVLLLIALATDLFTPLLIWKGLLPAAARWLSHAALAAMMADAYARMMTKDVIPRVAWMVVWLSVVGLAVARLRGQGLMASGWGWWVMFQFPLVGLYTYISDGRRSELPAQTERVVLGVLALEVFTQLVQLALGETPGDSLAGTFGQRGTHDMVMFSTLVIAIGLGRWLTTGEWKPLTVACLLGMITSVLGEMKVFIPALLALAAMATVVFALRKRQFGRLLQYLALLAAVLLAFARLYDVTVAERRGTRPIGEYLRWDTLDGYLSASGRSVVEGRYYYNLGRNYAVVYGWNEIRRDLPTLLFGMGLGARGESKTLGSTGAGLQQGTTGLTSGTSLLVLMQELGLSGLLLVCGFLVWAARRLWHDIRQYPQSNATAVRYGLLFYTALWPLWVWYTSAWTIRVAAFLYWAGLGYVMRLGVAERRVARESVSRPPSLVAPAQAGHRMGMV